MRPLYSYQMEFYTGVVQFISCLYVLPVVPFQMKRAGYDQEGTIMATAVTCCIGETACIHGFLIHLSVLNNYHRRAGCIIGAFLTDMVCHPTSMAHLT